MTSETIILIRRIEQWLLNLEARLRKAEQMAGRALQAASMAGGGGGSGLAIRFATSTATGIAADTSDDVDEEDAAGTPTGNTFVAKNRHPTEAVGNSVKLICFDDGVDVWVIWEACP